MPKDPNVEVTKAVSSPDLKESNQTLKRLNALLKSRKTLKQSLLLHEVLKQKLDLF